MKKKITTLDDIKKVIYESGLTRCESMDCEDCEFGLKGPHSNTNLCLLLNEVYQTKQPVCEICGKKCVSLYELRMFEGDDSYTFNSCEHCIDRFESDTYTVQDVYDYINQKKNESGLNTEGCYERTTRVKE